MANKTIYYFMIISVFGSKTFDNYKLLTAIMNKIIQETKMSDIQFYTTNDGYYDKETAINYGVCHFLDMYCDLTKFPIKFFDIEWDNILTSPNPVVKEKNGKKYNARAAFDRNEKMVLEADFVILIHKGETEFKNVIELCSKYNKVLFNFDFSRMKK